jgi:hypothetical protein
MSRPKKQLISDTRFCKHVPGVKKVEKRATLDKAILVGRPCCTAVRAKLRARMDTDMIIKGYKTLKMAK